MFFLKNNRREQVQLLPVESVAPNPAQPRTQFDEQELEQLAQSILQNGLLQPISVRALPEHRYELISGERRLRACKSLGQATIKAIVIEADDRQSAVFAMIENLQREQLSFFDEARGIHELIFQWHVTQEEAAIKLGMAQSTLANKLRLLRLEPEIQRLVAEHGLTERHARALLKVTGADRRRDVIAAIARKKMNVSQTERYIEDFLQPTQPAPQRLLVVKDLRIFINTIDRAVSTMKQAGIEAKVDQCDDGDFIEYTVKIPKTSAYQQRHHPQVEKPLLKVSG